MRRAVLLVSVVSLLSPAAASAHGGAVDDAIDAFETTPVYVDPDASPTISSDRAEALADRIRFTGRPIYIAVLSEQDDDAHDVAHELVDGVGKPGTYVAVVAGKFGVHSTEVDHERADRIAARAEARPPDELAATLDDVVADVESTPVPDPDDPPWVAIALALAAIAAIAAGLTWWAVKRRHPAAS